MCYQYLFSALEKQSMSQASTLGPIIYASINK